METLTTAIGSRMNASIHPEEFRPGNSSDALKFSDSTLMAVTVRVHYHYYSVVIALSRLSLNVQHEGSSRSVTESKKALLNAARAASPML